mmetsp:Transcript_26322/g.52886  ORF Transcript_26322/g.52886 Transcript_26322/m.52886 type:complete len:97 (+) Transcript_26322:1150-1440(+)
MMQIERRRNRRGMETARMEATTDAVTTIVWIDATTTTVIGAVMTTTTGATGRGRDLVGAAMIAGNKNATVDDKFLDRLLWIIIFKRHQTPKQGFRH